MTVYWWSHWFWITILNAVVYGIPISSVDTTSLKSLQQQNSRIYNNKREPLKFPLAAQSDTDDIVDGDDSFFKGDWIGGETWIGGSSTSEKQANNLEINSIKKDNLALLSNFRKSSGADAGSNSTINSDFIGTNINKTTTTNTTQFEKLNSSLSEFHQNSSDIKSNSTEEITTSFETLTNTNSSSETTSGEDYNADSKFKEKLILNKENNNDTPGSIISATAVGTDQQRRKSKILSDYREDLNRIDNVTGEESKNLLTRSAISSDGLSEALSIENTDEHKHYLNFGTISGICLSVIGMFCVVSISAIILYRRRFVNNPQTLSEPDSSGYIDDSTIRDNSDEMYSLDNDSFLNSLEAMTIQNYWTDSVKHTKL